MWEEQLVYPSNEYICSLYATFKSQIHWISYHVLLLFSYCYIALTVLDLILLAWHISYHPNSLVGNLEIVVKFETWSCLFIGSVKKVEAGCFNAGLSWAGLVAGHHLVNPPSHLSDPSVDTWVVILSTSNAPRDNSNLQIKIQLRSKKLSLAVII